MEYQTLVIDRCYVPVQRISWTDAITMWWTGRAEILEEYDEVVRSPSREMRIPAVVRFVTGRLSYRRTGGARYNPRNLYLRDRGRCQYCGRKLTEAEATKDHFVPRERHGQTNWENILLACLACNQKKGSMTPKQAQMVPLSRPHRPKKGALPLVPGLSRVPADVPALWQPYLRAPRPSL